MKTSIANLRSNLSQFIEQVEKGHEVKIQKRNIDIAKLVPIFENRPHSTKLGNGIGTGKILGDITEPMIDPKNWNMNQRKNK